MCGNLVGFGLGKMFYIQLLLYLCLSCRSNNLTVDTLTGNITTKGPIDREKISTPNDIMQLVVIATDSGSIPRSNTVKVFVTVLDINDNMPILAEPIANLTLLEGTGPGVIYDIKVSFINDVLLVYLYIPQTLFLGLYCFHYVCLVIVCSFHQHSEVLLNNLVNNLCLILIKFATRHNHISIRQCKGC